MSRYVTVIIAVALNSGINLKFHLMLRAKPVLVALRPLGLYHVTQGQSPRQIRDVAVYLFYSVMSATYSVVATVLSTDLIPQTERLQEVSDPGVPS